MVPGVFKLLMNGWRVEFGRRLLPYDLFRWWGRRPALLLDAIFLDAAGIDDHLVKSVAEARLKYRPSDVLNGTVICDPMCGGGTSAFEALFLGASKVICSDINFASSIVIKATAKVVEDCSYVVTSLLSMIREVFKELYDIWCINDYCYLHTFLTRNCNDEYCYALKWVTTIRTRDRPLKIIINERGELEIGSNVTIHDVIKLPKSKLVEVGKGVYAYAVEMYDLRDPDSRVLASLVVDEFIRSNLHESMEKAVNELSQKCSLIPLGKETRRLIRDGFTCWEHLFTPRQLLTFKKIIEYIYERNKDLIEVVSALLATAMGSSSILALYYQPLARVSVGLVVKSFWVPQYPVELNPLAGSIEKVKNVGRGTIFTYIRKIMRACKLLNELGYKGVSDKIEVAVKDALESDYTHCNIVILDPPYPGKVAYDELTQLYLIPYRLLDVSTPQNAVGKSVDIYNLNSYTGTLIKLIFRIVDQAPHAKIYLLISNDDKGREVYSRLSETLKVKNINMMLMASALAEATHGLGKGKTREIMILKIQRAVKETHEA